MSPWMQVYILLVKTDLNFCLELCYAHPVCWWSSLGCSTRATFNSSLFLSTNYNLMPLTCSIFPFSFYHFSSHYITTFPSFPWWYLVFSIMAHHNSHSSLGICVECLELKFYPCTWLVGTAPLSDNASSSLTMKRQMLNMQNYDLYSSHRCWYLT